jgi:tetratricopeptide (TPR) repeat protein
VELQKKSTYLVTILLGGLLFLFSAKTYSRNRDWKNNETLDLTDVKTATNSVRTNQYATELYVLKANEATDPGLKRDYYNKAVYYGERTIQLYPGNPTAYLNLGFAYFGLQEYLKSADLFRKGHQLMPADPQVTYWNDYLSTVLYKQGNGSYENGDVDQAIVYYKKATELDDKKAEAWYNLGGCYFVKNDDVKGMLAWEKVKLLVPNHRFNKEEFLKK